MVNDNLRDSTHTHTYSAVLNVESYEKWIIRMLHDLQRWASVNRNRENCLFDRLSSQRSA